MTFALYESSIKSLPLLSRGKVRDIYAVDDQHLLIVTTDRLSAFDVILPNPIPGKGQVLTAMSNFWFNRIKVLPNQLTGIDPASVVQGEAERQQVLGRAMVVKRLKALPLEAVVRGYLAGGGWKEYKLFDSICSVPLPPGLKEGQQLPEPIFTPSTKEATGKHDVNISFDQAAQMLGEELTAQVRDVSIAIYREAAAYALERGIIIADTKFEFGVDNAGQLYWIDEAITPDSSRFWPKDEYVTGTNPPSFDKQFVRNYLESIQWNKKPPAPTLPLDIINKTEEKYREALKRITGQDIPDPV